MMASKGKGKIERILGIYTKLMNGYIVNKSKEADECGVNEKSIQRDIKDINDYLSDSYIKTDAVENRIKYDDEKKGYYLENTVQSSLTNSEVLAICKILLDSRAFTNVEMQNMLNKLIKNCVPLKNQKLVTELIRNEAFHYIEPQHKKVFIDIMWDIGQAIQCSNYIEIEYFRTKDKSVVTRKVIPVAIMFSEYYFYLTAFIDDENKRKDFDVINDTFPTIYRIDRIQKLKVLKEKFNIPYESRFEEGEFRKRIQFMYGGAIRRVKFEYSGSSIEAVLDRLPTAKILEEKDGKYIVFAEVFGNGIDMWLRSQGDAVKVMDKLV